MSNYYCYIYFILSTFLKRSLIDALHIYHNLLKSDLPSLPKHVNPCLNLSQCAVDSLVLWHVNEVVYKRHKYYKYKYKQLRQSAVYLGINVQDKLS